VGLAATAAAVVVTTAQQPDTPIRVEANYVRVDVRDGFGSPSVACSDDFGALR
jgi:hypothetical protein